MKLIKKIAAIMLSVMMVLGMASVVSASEGGAEAATGNGKITITNAIPGQTYKIYRILELESYDETTNNYAYKATPEWNSFINSSDATAYFKIDNNGGVTWIKGNGKPEEENARVAAFAKLALNHVKSSASSIAYNSSATATSKSVEFSNLPLGYYLVDSSVGALCSLNTTKPIANIEEKNGVPSVDKNVKNGEAWKKNSTANIGDIVEFQTTITAQPGAEKYLLHDKMEKGLTFLNTNEKPLVVKYKSNLAETTLTSNTQYTLKTTELTDECTFEISFAQEFCNTLKANDQIIVTYSATLNKKAVIAGEGNKNETWLKYGDSSTTTHSTTTTKTFELPVFKYTMKNSTETALAGATFTLSKNTDGAQPISLVKTSEETYRVATTDETNTMTEVTTTDSGKFTIEGLSAGTYYLTETKQPAGYNKLSAPITVVIDENGNITVNGQKSSVTEVKVQNNTGTILPTTGGNGTSLIYFLGAVLALVSGVVLITKQRMKNS